MEPQTSEAQGLAYVFRFLNADPDVIRLFAKFHGNMKLVLGDDMRKVGEFLAVYPGAANALPFCIAPKPSMPLTPQLLNACCEALSEESSPVTFSFLNSALGEPMSDVETISALTNLVQTRACGDDKHRRFSILVAALQVSEDPIRTVEVVRQQGFNLKNALSPVDFGRAMGTNLLEWETVCAWVAAPVSEEGRNAAHVGPAQFGKPNSASSRLELATGRSARGFTAYVMIARELLHGCETLGHCCALCAGPQNCVTSTAPALPSCACCTPAGGFVTLVNRSNLWAMHAYPNTW